MRKDVVETNFLLTNNKIPFGKNSYLGVDIIKSVFDICDVKETEDGLSLMEVKEGPCMNYLEMVLGMLDKDIDEDFKAIDENGDGLVSKEECFKAYENFALDRAGPISNEEEIANWILQQKQQQQQPKNLTTIQVEK